MAFDYSKLTPEQNRIALKVLNAAEKYGLNPDFVLPMVMGESQFQHIPSNVKNKDGTPVAHGVMMLTKNLAKHYGDVDYQKADEDTNIDVGMRYLKDLVSNPKIGSDPKKVLTGYNAGPSSKFITTGNEDDLPEETRKHIKNVTRFSANDELVPVAVESKPAPETDEEDEYADLKGHKPEVRQAIDDAAYDDLRTSNGPAHKSKPLPSVYGMYGAGVGAVSALAGELLPGVAKKAANFVGFEPEKELPIDQSLFKGQGQQAQEPPKAEEPTTETPAAEAPAAEAPVETGVETHPVEESELTPGEKWAEGTGYGIGEGNYSVAEANQAYKRRGVSKNSKIAYKNQAKFGIPQTGGSKDVVQRLIDMKNAQQEAAQAKADAAKKDADMKKAAEDKVLADQMAKEKAARDAAHVELEAARNQGPTTYAGKVANLLGDIVRGGMHGANAAYQTITGSQTPDNTESGLRFTSALGSAADVASHFLPQATKAIAQKFTNPLAILAGTGADVIHDVNQKDIGGALGSAAIGASTFLPGGLPTAAYLQWAKDNPDKAAEVRNQVSDIAPLISP